MFHFYWYFQRLLHVILPQTKEQYLFSVLFKIRNFRYSFLFREDELKLNEFHHDVQMSKK